jgi:hypothetical protein
MSMPDHVSPDLELPEQHLLRDGDRMQDYAGAFLRGDITAQQYSELTLAEINRRAPIDPLLPLGEPEPQPIVEPVREVAIEPARAQHSDSDRATVLAEAFVSGRIRGGDFLRLIRDC